MFREMLKAKIHRATVTGADVNYEGSIAIDDSLLEAVGILPGEKVLIVNLRNGSRVDSYAISAKAGSGKVSVNGGAALHSSAGDKVIIMNFCLLDEKEVKRHKAKVVLVDEKNRIIRRKS